MVLWNNGFMSLIKEIEALRLKRGLTKTAMASEFGVIYQNYNNWIARASLPKEHYEKAYKMLQSAAAEPQSKNQSGITLKELWESTSPEERAEFLRDLASKR